jgi:hypothetical protein
MDRPPAPPPSVWLVHEYNVWSYLDCEHEVAHRLVTPSAFRSHGAAVRALAAYLQSAPALPHRVVPVPVPRDGAEPRVLDGLGNDAAGGMRVLYSAAYVERVGPQGTFYWGVTEHAVADEGAEHAERAQCGAA